MKKSEPKKCAKISQRASSEGRAEKLFAKMDKGKNVSLQKIRIKIVSKGLVQWEIVVDILDRGAEFVKVSMLIRYQARIEKLKTAMKGLS